MRIKAVWFRMAVFHAAAKLVEVLTGKKPKSRRRPTAGQGAEE
jgi:hypothetical protein